MKKLRKCYFRSILWKLSSGIIESGHNSLLLGAVLLLDKPVKPWSSAVLKDSAHRREDPYSIFSIVNAEVGVSKLFSTDTLAIVLRNPGCATRIAQYFICAIPTT